MDLDASTRYGLAPTVRCLLGPDDAIRLRIGVWNYRDVTLDLSDEPPAVGAALRTLFGRMSAGELTDPDPGTVDLNPIQRGNVTLVLDELTTAGFLTSTATAGGARGQQLVDALVGHPIGLQAAAQPARVGLVVDSEQVGEQLHGLLHRCDVEAKPLDAGLLHQIRSLDSASGVDTIGAERLRIEMEPVFAQFGVLAVCLTNPDLDLLRNLNRLAFELDKPAVIGLRDGPFASVVGIRTPATGCFECFELRSLARLEDHVLYHQFKQASGATAALDELVALAPILPMVAAETALMAHCSSNRVLGRVFNMYLATLEIQVHDLLRMPGCPCCGVVSQGLAAEANFSSRVAIDSLMMKVLDR